MTQRLLCRLDYSSVDPASQAGEYDFTEFCWVGLFELDDFVLSADSGLSPYGSRIEGMIFPNQPDVGMHPANVTEKWDVTTPRAMAKLVSAEQSSLDWNKPSREFLVLPDVGTCSVCSDDLPPNVGISVDGVTASGDMVSLRNTWANGSYDVVKEFACVYDEWLPQGAGPTFGFAVRYEVVYKPGVSPNTAIVQVATTATREEMGFIEQAVCSWTSVEYPMVDGKIDCGSKKPISLSVIPGTNFTLPEWDWSTSTISVEDWSGLGETPTDAFPYKRLTTYGFSECYDIESFAAPDPNQGDGFMSEELLGVLSAVVPSQSIDTTGYLDLEAPVREVGGQWWDPGGDATEIIVPAPINFIRCKASIVTSVARTNFISLQFHRNGSSGGVGWPFSYDRHSHSAQNSAVSIASAWVPVSEGDIIQLRAGQTGGVLNGTSGLCWVEVQGRYLVT